MAVEYIGSMEKFILYREERNKTLQSKAVAYFIEIPRWNKSTYLRFDYVQRLVAFFERVSLATDKINFAAFWALLLSFCNASNSCCKRRAERW